MDKILSERKHMILCGAIEDYIADACPITSGGVKDKHIKDISSATLRNELNALEAMGYLKQLHTSSGRTPTAEGYKYYVNSLLKNAKTDNLMLDSVKEIIENRTISVSEIISEIANIISKNTKYPTIISMNGYDKLVIENINLIPLIDNQILMLIKTKSGVIHKEIKMITNPKACEQSACFINRHFKGETIGYMIEELQKHNNALEKELLGFKFVVENVINVLKKISDTGTLDIKREGTTKFLTDNKDSLQQTKNILNLLENEEDLKSIVDVEDDQKDITLSFGREDQNEKICGCAIVRAPLIIDGQRLASIGILGPERMDYAIIASTLRYVMNELENYEWEGLI